MPNVLNRLLSAANVSDELPDGIPSGQTNVALASTLATFGTALWTLLDPNLLTKVLGAGATAGPRAALAIGVLAAGALIATTDLLVRAYTATHQSPTSAGTADTAPDSGNPSNPGPPVIPAPSAAPVQAPAVGAPVLVTLYTNGRASTDWVLYSVAGDDAVIVKGGETPQRVPLIDLAGQ
ncbi:MAG: hypothetical protein JWO67_4257 [Streptosporangiaceae bacterium]|nr:hypothetical protein [Streptosporangiaceae bacterium]